MIPRPYGLWLFFPTLLLSVWCSPVVAAEGSPRATVDRLHSALIAIMQAGPGLDVNARRTRIGPVVSQSFDFELIAQIALGPEWSSLDDTRRRRMTDLMRRLSEATYADRFSSSDGERFEHRGEQTGRRGRRVVRTAITKNGQVEAELDYVLHQTPDGWRIINVLANGVSDLSLKRSQYASIIRKQGVDVLLERIGGQIAKLLGGDAPSG